MSPCMSSSGVVIGVGIPEIAGTTVSSFSMYDTVGLFEDRGGESIMVYECDMIVSIVVLVVISVR